MSPDKIAIGARLRAERKARGWDRQEMARRLGDALPGPRVDHESLVSYVKRWERGAVGVSERYRMAYARSFGLDEEQLWRPPQSSLWHPPHVAETLNGAFTPDDEQRLVAAAHRSVRVDAAVVESLSAILAAQRRLDDTVGPAVILPATAAQTDAVIELLRDARGEIRDALVPVAGQWVQFSGWLHAELRNDRTAVHLLTDAEDLADEAHDGTLAAQAANFKGYLARQQGNPRGIVRHFLAAYHTPGASPAQRLGDALQAAHGHALLGEDATARRLLNEAAALEERAARGLPPDTAYWLTPDFQHINIGLALLALGEHADAAEHLAAGLDSLPSDQRHADWTREYWDALTAAQ